MPPISLRTIDMHWLRRLSATAAAQADPAEVMPPTPGGPEWTSELITAFENFHRRVWDQPGHRTFVITRGDEVLGAIRLDDTEIPGELETGLWLARSARNQGVGTAAVGLVLARAAQLGADAVIADTAPDNRAAQVAMERNGATLHRGTDRCRARFPLPRV